MFTSLLRRVELLSLCVALVVTVRAHAVNRVVNGDFEGSTEPGHSWTASGGKLPWDISETSFGTDTYAGSSEAFIGGWQVDDTSQPLSLDRHITQDFKPNTNVRAKLRAKYRRDLVGDASRVDHFTLSIVLRQGSTPINGATLIWPGAADTDIQDTGWLPVVLNANTTYTIDIGWNILFKPGHDSISLGAGVDNIELQVSPAAPTLTQSSPAPSIVNIGFSPTSGGDPPVAASEGYMIYRATLAGSESFLATVNASPATDNPLDGNTIYYYALADVDTSGEESPQSPEASILTVPGQPTALTSEAITQTSIPLSWTAPTNGAATYSVERSQTSANGPWKVVGTPGGTVTSFTDTVTCGTTFWYHVRGSNASGNSIYSDTYQASSLGCLTQIESGTDPASAVICPGAAAQAVNAFTVSTSGKLADTIRSITVTFESAADISKIIDSVSLEGPNTSASATPSGNTVTFDTLNVAAASGTPTTFSIRVTPKGHSMPSGIDTFKAKVTSFTSDRLDLPSDANLGTIADTSQAFTINNAAPPSPAWGTVTTGNRVVNLAWTSPAATGTVIFRGTTRTLPTLLDGTDYFTASPPSGWTRVNASATDTSKSDTTVSNGTTYYYAAAAKDGCLNWSSPVITGPIVPVAPRPTTYLADGDAVTDTSLCPSTIGILDKLTLRTDDTDTLTGVTLTLSQGSFDLLSKVEILDDAAPPHVLGTATPTAGTSLAIPISPPVSLSTTPKSFSVRVTAKDSSLTQGTYTIAGTITDVACTNPKSGKDSSGAVLTIDRNGPAAPTLVSYALDSRVRLSWTSPGSDQVLVLRGTSELTAAPSDGTSYSANDKIESGKVIYVGNTTSLTDSDLTNGQTYFYAIFARDACGNWSPKASTGAVSPQPGELAIGDALTEPGDQAICPQALPTAIPVDEFALVTGGDPVTISSLTIALGEGNVQALARVEIADKDGNVLGSVGNATADDVTVTLKQALTVGPDPQTYTVRLTPKAAKDFPADVTTVGLTARVFAANRTLSGEDKNGATITLDLQPPEKPTWKEKDASWGAFKSTWENPKDADLAQVILVEGIKDGDAPERGRVYKKNDSVGSGRVIHEDTVPVFIKATSKPTRFALFARDACGNWSPPSSHDLSGGADEALLGCSQSGMLGSWSFVGALALLAVRRRRRRRATTEAEASPGASRFFG